MSVPTIILGYLEEAWPGVAAGGNADFLAHLEATATAILRHNEAAAAALPEEDTFPPLCRPMFGYPAADTPMIAFRNRIIHFGACLRNADFCLRDWLDKFEDLLRKTYWETAYVRCHATYLGTHEFGWQPTKEWCYELCKGRLHAINEWSFTSTMEDSELDRLRGG